MPELPEVETVRAGLARFVSGRTIASVEVRHPRSVRRHRGGAADFAATLAGATVASAERRGKYLWMPFTRPPGADVDVDVDCMIVHLGMSGQLLVQQAAAPDERHLHVRFRFDDGGSELRFVDQRTFGGLQLDRLDPDRVPEAIAHIARDPLDPRFDDALFVARLRRRRTELKRALLDQSLISGIGNIYADETLWLAKLSGQRPADSLSRPVATSLLGSVRAVLEAALAQGGTSFDALYVNVNGESGYFERSLEVYGRAGQACRRCGSAIVRRAFMNRSSYYCPRCQRPPRGG
jgi:formamidopyrimidine-DNA glycosylase